MNEWVLKNRKDATKMGCLLDSWYARRGECMMDDDGVAGRERNC